MTMRRIGLAEIAALVVAHGASVEAGQVVIPPEQIKKMEEAAYDVQSQHDHRRQTVYPKKHRNLTKAQRRAHGLMGRPGVLPMPCGCHGPDDCTAKQGCQLSRIVEARGPMQ